MKNCRRFAAFGWPILAAALLVALPVVAQKSRWQKAEPNSSVHIIKDVRDAAELNLKIDVLPIALRQSNAPICIAEDGRGFLWVGHNAGASRFDGYEWRQFSGAPNDSTGLMSDWAGWAATDENGDFWLAQDGGICRYVDSSESFESFRHLDFFNGPGIGKSQLRVVAPDQNGGIWCGSTAIGLCRFDLKSRRFERNMGKTCVDEIDPEKAVVPLNVVDIEVEKSGRLWCAAFQESFQQGRLHSFDPKTGAWQRFTFSNEFIDPKSTTWHAPVKNTVWGVTLDEADSLVWVNGPVAGLRCFDLKTRRWQQFFIAENALSSSDANIHAVEMEPFADSLLVIGRNDGPFVFHKKTRAMYRFLKIGDQQPIDGRMVFSNRFGDLWLSSQFAFFKLENPKTADSEARRPHFWLKSFSADGEKKLVHPTVAPPKFTLAADCQKVELSFFGLPFMVPNRLEYRYRFNKKGQNWIELGQQNSFILERLAGGEHELFLQVRRPNEAWSESVAVAFLIDVPFWKNTWFRILAALILGGGGFFFYRQKIREARQEADFQRQLAEVEMASLRAQMNPHFLFNCLASINHLVQKNDAARATLYLTKFSKLVRLILENSENERISLKNEADSVRLYLDMEALRFEPKLHFEVILDPKINAETVRLPPLLVQPFVENAIWHGLMNKKSGGSVRVEFRLDGQPKKLLIIIEDDGVGRQRAREIAANSALKTKSHGLQITADRLRLLNDLGESDASANVFDLTDSSGAACGTRVELRISI